MRSIKVGWLIVLSLVLFLLLGGYHLYSQQTARFEHHEANIREMKKLTNKQAELIKIPVESKDDGESLRLLATKKGDLWFMEDIEERLGASISPTFLLIGPMKREEKTNHIRFSRQMSLEASFPELISLLDILETNRGFTISQLQIALNPDKAQRHRINFWLNCIQIKESFLAQLGIKPFPPYQEDPVISSLLLDVPWKPGEKLVLNDNFDDPFVKVEPPKKKLVKKKVAKRYRRSKRAKKTKVLAPINLAGQYTLQGVIKVAGKQMALIAPDHVLEKGDWLGNKQLVSILEDEIILKAGKQKYFLRLPGVFDSKDEKSGTFKKLKGKRAKQSDNVFRGSVAARQGERRVAVQ